MTYSPFQDSYIEALTEESLQELLTEKVTEGYYVEYKRELPAPKKIAKSLASFANTYGGWYIVGVETDEHNVANQISGFSKSENHDPISSIRDAARHHIDPTPLFFSKVITLQSERLVVIVHIPENQECPYITKDGRLYRRTSDCSEPIPENNRHALDQLVERGKEVSKKFARFSQDNRILGVEEQKEWLNIYLSPYPLGLIEKPELLSREGVQELIEKSKNPINLLSLEAEDRDKDRASISANIEFNAAQLTPTSVVLKNASLQNEMFNTSSIELDIIGRAKLRIALEKIDMNSEILPHLKSRRTKRELEKRLFDVGHPGEIEAKFIDIGKLWLTIAVLTSFYQEWIESSTSTNEFNIAIEIDGVHKCVPFYDHELWGKYVETLGLPVLLRNTIRIPEDESKSIKMSESSNIWMSLCLRTCAAFGITYDFLLDAIGPVILEAAKIPYEDTQKKEI